MTTEAQAPGGPEDEGQQWLDGLAGREASGPLGREGARLRQQLAWPADPGLPAGMPPDLASLVARQQAGVPQRQHRWAWAAVLVLAFGVGWWQMAPEPTTWRGGGGSPVFQWVVDGAPADSATPLAQELRQLGAEVQLQALTDRVELQVSASEPARTAVNARLAALEAALDAQGRCRIQVRR